MKKRLYGAMMVVSIILLVGTAGAVDHDTVSWGMALIQAGLSLALGLIGWFGIRLEERRGR